MSWRILNINEDTIELISDKPTSSQVYFTGARGYNNGVALLNDYCKAMYSNKSKGAVARSLNIEDIQDKMEVDETTGDLTVTQTFWYLDSSTMSTNFETADTRDDTKANSMYYELLCYNGRGCYWLASRYVDTSNVAYAFYDLHNMGYNGVFANILSYSVSSAGSVYSGVRPVVSIPSNAIDISTEYDESIGWTLNNN